MTQKITYFGSVDSEAKLSIHNKKAFLSDLRVFCGKRVEIIVQRVRSKRSGQQNKYYWAVIVPCVMLGLRDIGWGHIKTNDDAHVWMAGMFLQTQVVNEITGEINYRIKSTTELTKSEFSDYTAEIQQWAAEYLGVVIPDPNEQTELNFER